jgi:hypothetical protein
MAYRLTKNPRISFVPSDEVHLLVASLSEASGKSRASIVSQLMTEIEPVIKGQLEAFQKIASRPHEARQLVQEYANQATAQIAQAMLDLDAPKQPRKRNRKVATSGPT